MDIEELIKKIIDKNFSIYEQERFTVLNALMGNIDILMDKTDEWFGKDIPEEFSRVIRSLFSLSAFLLEKRNSSFEISKIKNLHEFNIHDFLSQFVNELKNILDLGEMKIISDNREGEYMIRSSEFILREAFYNIFFSLYPFMKRDSSCVIKLEENRINIAVEFIFDKLLKSFPGPSEIKKNIYTYRHGEEDKIGIGIDSAIVSLRNAGAVLKINELISKEKFSLTIMFPALDFYADIEHVRAGNKKSNSVLYGGEIFLNINDPFMRLVITDTLHELGYSITHFVSSEFTTSDLTDLVKAVVLEYNTDNQVLIKKLENTSKKDLKIIIICNENDLVDNPFLKYFMLIIKPFNVEDLIERIENE